uniref:Uncharacterized protein n=1 Tax=Branchiostoma floridae TaxID=7739 RepID=C3ZL67_BRAFL|eukprot:XP_002590738.1 hypothetical protein BRAFLDRAFT_78153 [Branchiostoma floridae]
MMGPCSDYLKTSLCLRSPHLPLLKEPSAPGCQVGRGQGARAGTGQFAGSRKQGSSRVPGNRVVRWFPETGQFAGSRKQGIDLRNTYGALYSHASRRGGVKPSPVAAQRGAAAEKRHEFQIVRDAIPACCVILVGITDRSTGFTVRVTMNLVEALLLIAVLVSNRQLQADDVSSDVYNTQVQADHVTSDVYNRQLHADDVISDVSREPTWCRESGGNNFSHHTECWRGNSTEIRGGRKSLHLRHETPFNVTISEQFHFPLRRNVLDSVRRSVAAAADGTAGAARLRRAGSRRHDAPRHGPGSERFDSRHGLGPDQLDSAAKNFGVALENTEEVVRLKRADGTSGSILDDWSKQLEDAEEIVPLKRAKSEPSGLVLDNWSKQLEDAAEVVRLKQVDSERSELLLEDWSKQLEDAEEVVRLRRANGKPGPVIEDWSKQLEAEEIIRVVSCQVDMSCSPVSSKACRCPHGQPGGCVVPRARVSQISRTRSGALNMFCVGVSLSHEEAGAQTPQTSCKYFSTDNAKYRVFATKVPEVGPTPSGKPRIRYRACLKPMS